MTTLIIGGGVAGLTAAYQARLAGEDVTLLEKAPRLGGIIHPVHLDIPDSAGTDADSKAGAQRLTVDGGAEAFAVRNDTVTSFVTELGLAEDIVTPNPAGSWLYLPDVGAVPAPKLGLMGIPADLDAPEVRSALGDEAVAEAHRRSLELPEHYRTAAATGADVTVADLVTDLLGPAVLDRLVAPVVAGVHSADPRHTDIRAVAPRLLENLAEAGSLPAAVAGMRRASSAGALVNSLRGGVNMLVARLAEILTDMGVQIRTSTAAESIDWAAHEVRVAGTEPISFDRLILATDGPATTQLLATLTESGGPELPEELRLQHGSGVGLVTLVIDHGALDTHPRGTGLLVAPSATDVAAKAMTHVSAKWSWLEVQAAAQRPHRHVVRLSYGRITDATDGSAPGYFSADEELTRHAVRDAAALLGIDPEETRDAIRTVNIGRIRSGIPASSAQYRSMVGQLQSWVGQLPNLQLTGASVAGTGLAAVIAHARNLTT